MADDSGGDGGQRASTKKSLRPEIQLYRPGMLRKGDSNKSLASDERPPRPENLNHHHHSGGNNSSRRRSNDTDSSVTSRNGSGSTTPDANAINEQRKYPNYSNRRNGGESSSYNSTQSLYDTRQSGGYVRGGGYSGGYNNQRQNANRRSYPSQNFERSFNRHNQNNGFNDRASMRSEGAITKRNDNNGRRKRNDSINSTQSEMPQTTNDQLHIDTSYDSASQCGASSAYSMDSMGGGAMSFEEMCASLQSFGSLDWSKEVENEFAMKIEREEQEAKRQEELKAALEAESQSKSPPKGMLRVNRNNKLQDSNGYRQRSPRNQRNRRNQRDESDRESSFGGSIAEEEGEYEDELKSGEKTPTSTKDAFGYEHKQYGNSRNNENKQQRSNRRHEERRYRGEHDDREDDSSQYDALSHMTSGRLAGRISIVKKEPEKQPHPNNKVSRKYSEPMIKKRNDDEVTIDVKIREISEKIQKLTPNVARKRDLEAAKSMVELSMKLSEMYLEVIFGSDIVNSFTNGVEQNLFKNAFHKPIDCLRTGSNSASPEAKLIRATFQRLLLNGIDFYEKLVEKLELEYDVRLDEALVWPAGFPQDNQLIDEFVALPCGIQKYSTSRQKTALKSISRHLISLGDLHRYKTLVDGSENYEIAQSYYLKSAQLWPSTGHPYNQLGVVAYYSMLYRSSRRARLIPLEILSRQRQTRVIDEIFFLTRALCCAHPYAAAKERLAQRLGAMRIKVSKYEPLLDAECGKGGARRTDDADRTREIWINAQSGEIRDDFGQRIVMDVLSQFMQQSADKLHRRAVSYLTDTYGMLVTKIGMDHFESVAERAFALLHASLAKRGEFTARQLAQLAGMFIYAAHFCEQNASLAHFTTSLNTIITFFVVLANCFFLESKGSELLILPALNLIATWILRRFEIFEKSDLQLGGLSSTILTGEQHEVKSIIAKVLSCDVEVASDATKIAPEIVYLASFCAIFDAYPVANKTSPRMENIRGACKLLDKIIVESPVATTSSATSSPLKSHRDELLDAERRKRADIEIVIRPESLVIDSNVLIDHLDKVRALFDARRFQLLIPTIVLSEIGGLTHEATATGEAARLALAWLKELAKLRCDCDAIATLTSQGNRIRFVIAFEDHTREQRRQNTVNDDTILEGCLKLSQNSAPLKIPQIANLPKIKDEQNALYRTTVLLTEDRGFAIKAASQQMPCMDICRFLKWAKLSSV